MMFKDSYLLDFINVEQIGEREAIDVDERVVEQQIVQNVKQFIMTFGRDATNKTTTDMPEELRKTLPDVEELKKLLWIENIWKQKAYTRHANHS